LRIDLPLPEASDLASSDTVQTDSSEEPEPHPDEKQYVCESCQASFAASQFDKAKLETILQELEDRLRALLNPMNEQQSFRFKQAAIRQAMHYVEEMLPPEEEDDGHRIGITMARRWLAEPTEEVALAAIRIASSESIDGGARYFDYPDYLLSPAFAAGAKDAWEAAHSAFWAGMEAERHRMFHTNKRWGEEGQHTAAIAKYAALEWQIAAAQAILRNSELPALN